MAAPGEESCGRQRNHLEVNGPNSPSVSVRRVAVHEMNRLPKLGLWLISVWEETQKG